MKEDQLYFRRNSEHNTVRLKTTARWAFSPELLTGDAHVSGQTRAMETLAFSPALPTGDVHAIGQTRPMETLQTAAERVTSGRCP